MFAYQNQQCRIGTPHLNAEAGFITKRQWHYFASISTHIIVLEGLIPFSLSNWTIAKIVARLSTFVKNVNPMLFVCRASPFAPSKICSWFTITDAWHRLHFPLQLLKDFFATSAVSTLISGLTRQKKCILWLTTTEVPCLLILCVYMV